MDQVNEILFRIIGMVCGVLLAWFVAVKLGRKLLKTGHGPLWALASVVVVLAGTFLSQVEDTHWLRLNYLTLVGVDPSNQVALALITLVVTFIVAWMAFKILYPHRQERPPMPEVFLWAGVAPDGSPLMNFRRSLWWLLGMVLVLATLTITAMEPPQDYTAWSFCYVGLLGLLLSATHPVNPISPTEPEALEQPVLMSKPRSDLDRLHRWLGSPEVVEELPAESGNQDNECAPRLGLTPYTYQNNVVLASSHLLALAGPCGTGRTTAALMSAVDLALRMGRTSVFITPTAFDADAMRQQAQGRLKHDPASMALMLERGTRLDNGDLWFVSLEELEAFLNGQTELPSHAFLRRLQSVVIEDVERLSGAKLTQARFLLHRLLAAAEADDVRVLLTGNMSASVLERVGRLLAARESIKIQETSGALSRDGGATLPVWRYVVDPDQLPVWEPDDVVREFKKIVEEDKIDAELFGLQWPTYRTPELDERKIPPTARELPLQALLAHVGPRTAWQILGSRRFYAGQEGVVREYLLFERDPMSQLILKQYLKHGTWWPSWYDAKRYPRILSKAPGSARTPQGLERAARGQLRAALGEAPQTVHRLNAVFSDRIVEQELEAMRSSGLAERVHGWRLDPKHQGNALHVEQVRNVNHAGARRDGGSKDALVRLVDFTDNLSVEVPEETLELEYYRNAIVTLRGQRYRIEQHPRRDDIRELQPVMDTDLRTAPVRVINCQPHVDELVFERARMEGQRALWIARGRIRLNVKHFGTRDFRSHSHKRANIWEQSEPTHFHFVTSALIVSIEGADEVALHTLTHVLRDVLDYFFHSASTALGVTYETDIQGRAGLVFFDRHPRGLGYLDSIDTRQDLRALLEAARHMLSACSCEKQCFRCCESMTCTLHEHQTLLNRHTALEALEGILQNRGDLAKRGDHV